MFFTVEIPGRLMQRVYRLPRQAVNFENKAYLVDGNGRLKTVAVSVERIEGEYVYVRQGLNPDDSVIVTRLIDPLENALLDIVDTASAGEAKS
jgi:hypothetical protein